MEALRNHAIRFFGDIIKPTSVSNRISKLYHIQFLRSLYYTCNSCSDSIKKRHVKLHIDPYLSPKNRFAKHTLLLRAITITIKRIIIPTHRVSSQVPKLCWMLFPLSSYQTSDSLFLLQLATIGGTARENRNEGENSPCTRIAFEKELIIDARVKLARWIRDITWSHANSKLLSYITIISISIMGGY